MASWKMALSAAVTATVSGTRFLWIVREIIDVIELQTTSHDDMAEVSHFTAQTLRISVKCTNILSRFLIIWIKKRFDQL